MILIAAVQTGYLVRAEEPKDDKIKSRRLLQSISKSDMPIVCRLRSGQEAFVISEPSGYPECAKRHGEVSRGTKADNDKIEVKPSPEAAKNGTPAR